MKSRRLILRRLRLTSATFWALVLAVSCLAGCAGYQLGPTNGVAARERSIQVTPFINHTLEPNLTDALTSQLRKELQRDGTYQLATQERGDIIVTGVITQLQRHGLSFVPSDTLTVRDFQLTLTAHVTARDQASGKVLLDRPVTGHTLMRVGSDLTASERQTLPLLAADLAKNVTALLVDGAW
jgi:hypothetical protein